MVPIPVCIEHLAFRDFVDHMEISQLISSVEWLTCFLSEVMISVKHVLKRALLKILDGCFSITVFFYCFFIFCNTKHTIIAQWFTLSMWIHVCDKNYILFGSVKGLCVSSVFNFFTVSTIKSFMRSSSWCSAC